MNLDAIDWSKTKANISDFKAYGFSEVKRIGNIVVLSRKVNRTYLAYPVNQYILVHTKKNGGVINADFLPVFS